MPIAAEHAFKEKSAKSLILLPLRTISKRTFQCETPCLSLAVAAVAVQKEARAGSTHHFLLRQNWELTPKRQLF